MRFCKDCRYIEMIQGMPANFANCVHPKLLSHDPVSGAVNSYCRSERLDLSSNLCGKDGKLFEPFQMVNVSEVLQ